MAASHAQVIRSANCSVTSSGGCFGARSWRALSFQLNCRHQKVIELFKYSTRPGNFRIPGGGKGWYFSGRGASTREQTLSYHDPTLFRYLRPIIPHIRDHQHPSEIRNRLTLGADAILLREIWSCCSSKKNVFEPLSFRDLRFGKKLVNFCLYFAKLASQLIIFF